MSFTPPKGLRWAWEVVGGLSRTTKMPGFSHSVPATACNVGSRLALVPDSPCSKCYARRGNYRWPNVKKVLANRLARLADERWVEAMVALINYTSLEKRGKRSKYFRWHDSGDVQSPAHLEAIFEVCRQTPEVHHYLPTKEYGLIKQYGHLVPDNLVVRVSAARWDQPPINVGLGTTSTVHRESPPVGFACPSMQQDHQCADCRACWDPGVPNISYQYY
ncbi:hypothetical protein LCGC14_0698470 [marine sediment metagenome]|uniref:Gene product 88 domain-containing protein n=1 Tax=marine sediment metagenome TaxID=412755 RepID=A0A0F9TR92_9ZZZZ